MPDFDYSIFILRAQPLHLGHEAIIQKAFTVAKHPIFIIGSSTSPISLRNPFTYEERKAMLISAIENLSLSNRDYSIFPVADSAYNPSNWVSQVNKIVSSVTEKTVKASIAILGHFRDSSSDYLNSFSNYTLISLEPQENDISSSVIREILLDKNRVVLESDLPCSPKIQEFLKLWRTSLIAKELMEEYTYILGYKKAWENTPYPPVFVTTDTVVVDCNHLLLIKRGRCPGKGKYALPGGFLNQDEYLINGALRELREETNISIPDDVLRSCIREQHVFDFPFRDPRGRMITHAYLIGLDTYPQLPKIEAADDASEVLWIPLQDLEKIKDQFFDDHYQIIRYFIY